MKFNFLKPDGSQEEINVSYFRGSYENDAGYLNSLLAKEQQPISYSAVKRIYKKCEEHAVRELEFARKVTMDAPHSTTAYAYRWMVRDGKMGDEDFSAISRVMHRLNQKTQETVFEEKTTPRVSVLGMYRTITEIDRQLTSLYMEKITSILGIDASIKNKMYLNDLYVDCYLEFPSSTGRDEIERCSLLLKENGLNCATEESIFIDQYHIRMRKSELAKWHGEQQEQVSQPAVSLGL